MTANKSYLGRVYDFLKGRHIDPDKLSKSELAYLDKLNRRVDGQETGLELQYRTVVSALGTLYNYSLPSLSGSYYKCIADGSNSWSAQTYEALALVIDAVAFIPETISDKVASQYNTACENYYKTRSFKNAGSQ